MSTRTSACPSCVSEGRDNKGDNLHTYDDGHSYCFACGYLSGGAMKVTLPAGELIDWTSRKISEGVMKSFGVYTPYTEGSKVLRNAVVFPYYDVQKKLVGYKLRDLDVDDGRKVCYVTGKQGLFGLNRVHGDTVVLTEGEVDALTLAHIYPKYTVLGIPGASTGKLVKEQLAFIRKFRRIYICVDNDKPGQDLADELVSYLPGYKTYRVNLTQHKDANEYLLSSDVPTLKSEFDKAERCGVSALTCDSEAKGLNDTHTDKGYNTGIDVLNKMCGGKLHVSELLALVGHTGRGKSQFAAQVVYNLVSSNEHLKVLYNCTEMTHKQMVRRFSQIHLGKRFTEPVTLVERKDSADWVYQRVRFNKYELTEPSEFYDTCVQAILEDDVRVVVIDVLNDIDGFSGDWKVAANTVSLLKKLAEGDERENVPPVAVIAVCHTLGDEVTLNSIKGGSAIRQRVTCAVGLLGEVNTTERKLVQLKQSRNYSLGVIEPGVLTYNTETTRYGEVNTNESSEDNIRQPYRKLGSSSLPAMDVSPVVSDIRQKDTTEEVQSTRRTDTQPVGDETTGCLHGSDETSGQSSSAQIYTGLPDNEQPVPGGEGCTEYARQDKDASGTGEAHSSDVTDVHIDTEVEPVTGSSQSRTAAELANAYRNAHTTSNPTDWFEQEGITVRTPHGELVSDEPRAVPTVSRDNDTPAGESVEPTPVRMASKRRSLRR